MNSAENWGRASKERSEHRSIGGPLETVYSEISTLSKAEGERSISPKTQRGLGHITSGYDMDPSLPLGISHKTDHPMI